MIRWIKSWLRPPILDSGISACPVCNRRIRQEMTRRQQRRCTLDANQPPRHVFQCGRCGGVSYWCLGNANKFIFMRADYPFTEQIYEHLLEYANDVQARYNIAVIKAGRAHLMLDTTDFTKLKKAEIQRIVHRLEHRIQTLSR